ncbi:MAG: hypothetical protein RIA62_01615 [Cyclobacteriaceae bacterium]
MKKVISFFTFFITAVMLQAQQTVDTVYVTVSDSSWTTDPLTWLGIIFVAATIILVLRTFRNKAEI